MNPDGTNACLSMGIDDGNRTYSELEFLRQTKLLHSKLNTAFEQQDRSRVRTRSLESNIRRLETDLKIAEENLAEEAKERAEVEQKFSEFRARAAVGISPVRAERLAKCRADYAAKPKDQLAKCREDYVAESWADPQSPIGLERAKAKERAAGAAELGAIKAELASVVDLAIMQLAALEHDMASVGACCSTHEGGCGSCRGV